jgi:hypothetical protein
MNHQTNFIFPSKSSPSLNSKENKNDFNKTLNTWNEFQPNKQQFQFLEPNDSSLDDFLHDHPSYHNIEPQSRINEMSPDPRWRYSFSKQIEKRRQFAYFRTKVRKTQLLRNQYQQDLELLQIHEQLSHYFDKRLSGK